MSKKVLLISPVLLLLVVAAVFAINLPDQTPTSVDKTGNSYNNGQSDLYTYPLPAGDTCDVTWTITAANGFNQFKLSSSDAQDSPVVVSNGGANSIQSNGLNKASTMATVACTKADGCGTGYSITVSRTCQQQEQEDQEDEEEPICVDGDGDGIESNLCGGTDCNDNDAAIFPGNAEVCEDGKDNNCNTQIDENCALAPPTDPTVTCTEAWTCGGWEKQGECVEDEQIYIRVCTDQNNCGTVVTKPVDTAPVECSEGESEAPTEEIIEELEEEAALAPAENNEVQDTNNDSEGTPKYVWMIVGGMGGLLAIFSIAGIIFFIKKQ